MSNRASSIFASSSSEQPWLVGRLDKESVPWRDIDADAAADADAEANGESEFEKEKESCREP